MGVLGSGYEQGSSWAVEVGGHMKICPILVENLNMNGQMLIEVCVYITLLSSRKELLDVVSGAIHLRSSPFRFFLVPNVLHLVYTDVM